MTISRADQVEFVRKELAMREDAYPLKIKMGRMTEKEAALGLARTRAVLESLEAAPNLNNGSVVKAEEHLAVVRELERLKNAIDDRYPKIEPVLVQIYQCAHEHANVCLHCGAVGHILEEVGFGK